MVNKLWLIKMNPSFASYCRVYHLQIRPIISYSQENKEVNQTPDLNRGVDRGKETGEWGIREKGVSLKYILSWGKEMEELKYKGGGGFRVKWEEKYSWSQGVETVPMEVMGYPTYIWP